MTSKVASYFVRCRQWTQEKKNQGRGLQLDAGRDGRASH